MFKYKKVSVRSIYYATKRNVETLKFDYVFGTLIDGIFTDIRTNEKFPMFEVCGNLGKMFIANNVMEDQNTVIEGFTPYITIVRDSYGKKTIKEIIDNDQYISKKFDEKYGQYTFKNKRELEQTLAIIKPDGVPNIEKIIDMIYKAGLTIKKYEVRTLDKEILAEHYSHLLDKPFYTSLESYMMSGEVAIMILEGYNAVDVLRDLMGPTDSTKASKDTIRGKFGTDVAYNAIHGSDSIENARIEIKRFFKEKVNMKK